MVSLISRYAPPKQRQGNEQTYQREGNKSHKEKTVPRGVSDKAADSAAQESG